MDTIAYKILWRHPRTGELWSFVSEDSYTYSVQYKEGERAYPKVGKLFVFDTLESLYTFVASANVLNTVVYKVMAYGVSEAYRMANSWYAHPDYISGFWSGGELEEHQIETTPTGTLFCDSLELLELIHG